MADNTPSEQRANEAFVEAKRRIADAHATGATELNLQVIGLSELPPELFDLTSLTGLDLSHTGLSSLPPKIGKLTALAWLNLSGTGLSSLPPELFNLTSLTRLNLSCTGLSGLPPEIGRLKSLTTLDLGDSGLVSLPSEIGKLMGLRELNLSRTGLVSLPPELFNLTSLTSLFLIDVGLISLPPGMGKLTSLTSLFLCRTSLSSLPPEIGNLKSLNNLDLSHTGLSGLPPEIGNLKSLTCLNLSDIGLSSLPPELFNLTSLTSLDLRRTGLSSLPSDLFNLTSLTRLDLSHTLLTSLSPKIGKLTALTRLDLSRTGLTSLPPEIGKLTALKELVLSSVSLSSLPSELFRLTALKELLLDNTGLISLPSEIGSLASLTRLDLRKTSLSSLPSEIGKLAALKELNLSDTGLSSLPPEIGKLTSLTWLVLSNTSISSLPTELFSLTSLAGLILSKTGLISLPSGIGKLTSLSWLYLSNTGLISLPPEIGKLTSLQELDLSNTGLSSLPPEIGRLTSLTRLDLANAHLSSLPSEIGGLTLLTRLDLQGNALSDLPRELRNLTRLQNIFLHGNPALGMPAEMLGDITKPKFGLWPFCSKPAEEVLESFFSLTRAAAPLHEARILVLGDGAVGKTSLARRLVYDKAASSAEEKTFGIAIARWHWNTAAGDPLTMHVWDFGGQGEMHAAHPYFFGRRTLYLLVVEGRQDHLIKERLGYWLEMIQSYAGKDAKVIIIQNKADQHMAHLNEDEWRERHSGLSASIPAFHHVSCVTGSGIDDLRNAVIEHVIDMPSVWECWPAAWMDVKRVVAKQLAAGPPTLGMEEFGRMCESAEVSQEADQMKLLKALHDLGLVVAFPDDHRLSHVGVLDPAWVRSGVYAVLNHPGLLMQRGWLRASDLANVLVDLPGYKMHHRSLLLEVMVKFELAFRTVDGWIIPSLLSPTAVPEARMAPFSTPDKPLRFEFHYEMLPETVITRFIARKHSISMHNGNTSWWRHGMLMECEGCPALVQAEVGRGGKITLAVAGPESRRRNALTVLRHAVDELHTESQREMVQLKVPLPDRPEVAVDYDELLLLEESGEKTGRARLRGKVITYLVSDLLGGAGLPSHGDVYINHINGDGGSVVIGNVSGGVVGGQANAIIDRRTS